MLNRLQIGRSYPTPLSFVIAITLCLLAAQAHATLRIMPLGDSITAGYTDNPTWNVPFNHGFRGPLHALLSDAGIDFTFVGQSPEPPTDGTPLLFLPNLNVSDWSFGGTRIPVNDLGAIGQDGHRGYGGAQSAGLIPRVGDWLVEDDPDIILLMIGTNDRNAINANTLIGEIINTKPDAELIVAEVIPFRSDFTTQNGQVRGYNAYLRSRVVPAYEAQGANITLVDQYSGFLTDPNDLMSINDAFMATGNHPNAAGYNQMAEVWFAGIQAVIPEPSSAASLLVACAVLLTRRQTSKLR